MESGTFSWPLIIIPRARKTTNVSRHVESTKVLMRKLNPRSRTRVMWASRRQKAQVRFIAILAFWPKREQLVGALHATLAQTDNQCRALFPILCLKSHRTNMLGVCDVLLVQAGPHVSSRLPWELGLLAIQRLNKLHRLRQNGFRCLAREYGMARDGARNQLRCDMLKLDEPVDTHTHPPTHTHTHTHRDSAHLYIHTRMAALGFQTQPIYKNRGGRLPDSAHLQRKDLGRVDCLFLSSRAR